MTTEQEAWAEFQDWLDDYADKWEGELRRGLGAPTTNAQQRDSHGRWVRAGGHEQLSAEYMRLHNEASKEFKEAFKRVGARLWHGDMAHPIKEGNREFIADVMKEQGPKAARRYYAIHKPLTVLDSYPNVTLLQRRQLNAEVDAVRDKYQKLLDAEFRKHIRSTLPPTDNAEPWEGEERDERGQWTAGATPVILIKREERFALDKSERAQMNRIIKEHKEVSKQVKEGRARGDDVFDLEQKEAQLKRKSEEWREVARKRLGTSGGASSEESAHQTQQHSISGALATGKFEHRHELRKLINQGKLGRLLLTAPEVGEVKEHGMGHPEKMRGIEVEGVQVQWADSMGGRSWASQSLPDLLEDDFPPALWKSTKRLIFSTQHNKADPFWEKQYGIKGFVSNATGGDGQVVVYNDYHPPTAFAHECGHNLATRVWGDVFPSLIKEPDYHLAQSVEGPVTDYGSKSTGEDFAEACKMYASEFSSGHISRRRLKNKFPKKYAALEALLTKYK